MADEQKLPVLVLDGANFDDFEGFRQEFSALLGNDFAWNGNLDAFNDILRGGFGTPDGGFVLRWANADRSREALGWAETVRYLEHKIERVHESNRASVAADLEHARRQEGATLFDRLVEIIREHESDGSENTGHVELQLS